MVFMIKATWNDIYFLGIDVLIGTPNKAEMFTTAGFNVNH
jgi:hypothetical protein